MTDLQTNSIGVERTDFVGVFTQDLERSIKFYGETLGLKRNERAHPEWPEFETGNLTLSLITPEKTGVEFAPSKGSIALRVPDVEAARRKLEEADVDFFGEVYDSGVCHMAFFSDPDGNALMLHRRYAPYSDGTQP
jgi:predicted enzyme related to lactoylglutathione lyase